MSKVTIGNSYSTVIGLSPQNERALREELSYETDANAAYFSGRYGPRKKCMIDKAGSFPTGLINRVLEFLIARCKIEVIDGRRKPSTLLTNWKFKVKPYASQLEALDAALLHDRGCLSMPTGTGKSLVIALIASRLNVKTLVVVPSLGIKEQLKEALKTFLSNTSFITVENIDSPALKKAEGYDCLIIDEAHHVAAKTYQKLNKTAWNGIYYRFFPTATPFRNNTSENLLFEGITGPIIYSLSYKDAVSKRYIVPIEAHYVDLPKIETDAFTWAEVYSQLVVKNDIRNNLIAGLMVQLNASSKPTLTLVKEIAHGEALARLTGFPFANGQDEATRHHIERFNRGEIKSLIGTTGILGEGVDTKPAEFIIIAGLGKAKSAFMQQVGRGVRTYPGKESAKIILFRDRSHKFTLRHFNEQRKILLMEYGIKPIKLEL